MIKEAGGGSTGNSGVIFNSMKNLKNKKGFTLIELLIVIAIIGILASIVLSSILSSKKGASVSAMKTTMQSVRTAMEMCSGTGGSIIPGERTPGSVICAGETYTYPPVADSCPTLNYIANPGSGEGDFSVTTTGTCGGCRLVCDVNGCRVGVEDNTGDCHL